MGWSRGAGWGNRSRKSSHKGLARWGQKDHWKNSEFVSFFHSTITQVIYLQTRWLVTTKAGHHLLYNKQLPKIMERLLGLMSFPTSTNSRKHCSWMMQRKSGHLNYGAISVRCSKMLQKKQVLWSGGRYGISVLLILCVTDHCPL